MHLHVHGILPVQVYTIVQPVTERSLKTRLLQLSEAVMSP